MPGDAGTKGEGSGSSRVLTSIGDRAGTAPPGMHVHFGDELGRLHSMVENLSRHGHIEHLLPDLPARWCRSTRSSSRPTCPRCFAGGVVQYVADDLEPDELGHPESVRAALCTAIEQCIPIAPPIRPVPGTRRIVALVGPTGVGKTTTVAKLAATLKLNQGAHVGLITVDTYRIAAVEQLKTYAEIIDLPLAVVNDPSEMPRALEELGPVDLVFIDTAGRSPRDEVKIRELAEFLQQAKPDEVYLVLSAVAGQRSLRSALERFSTVQVDRLILTKLDEADSLGGLLCGAGVVESTRELFDHGSGRARRHRAGRPQAAGTADPQAGGSGLKSRSAHD